MKPILEIYNLSKKYTLLHEEQPYLSLRDTMTGWFRNKKRKSKEEFFALKDLSFQVNTGETIGIIGKNGAGKSTLLKILSKITPPTSGHVISRGRVASLLEVGTGFHPELNGRENIYLNGSILGLRKQEIAARFKDIVDFSGLEKFLDTPLKHYSSGMQLRLAFAVAAFLEPEILIIDEVLAVGDADFQKRCLNKMDDVSKSGRTILFVSHQMGTISRLCSRTLLMSQGTLIKDGPTQEIVDHYLRSGENYTSNYKAEAETLERKDMGFTEVATLTNEGAFTDSFSFDESICLELKFRINRNVPNVKIGVALLNKYDSRVFTVVKSLDELVEVREGNYEVRLRFPSSLIAPNTYSFTCALFVPFGKIQDIQEGICQLRVFDTGTDLAIFEGIDYGNIIVNADWQVQN